MPFGYSCNYFYVGINHFSRDGAEFMRHFLVISRNRCGFDGLMFQFQGLEESLPSGIQFIAAVELLFAFFCFLNLFDFFIFCCPES